MPSDPTASAAFRLYKTNGPFEQQPYFADYLNTSLANGISLPSSWQSVAQELDSLICERKLVEEMCLYRAMPDCYLTPHIGEGQIRYPPFMSTSTDVHGVQRHFASPLRKVPAALLRITCRAGTAALNLENVQYFGGLEQEYLLPRNSVFEIVKIETITDLSAMCELMSPVYAKNYSCLRIYELRYLRRTT
jgi:hypothetical protein